MSRHLLNASLYAPWLLAVSLASACASTADPLRSDEASRDPGAGEVACHRGERTVIGSKVETAGRACIGASSVLGCVPEGRPCDDGETVVRGSDGTQWSLSDLCIPSGYSPLANDEAQKILSYPRCSGASDSGAEESSACGSAGRGDCPVGECPLSAQRVDEARGCLANSEPVACWPAGSSCPPVILFGHDARGARWSFPSGCIPQGFTRVPENEVPQLVSLPWCNPPMTPRPPCEEQGVEACRDDKRCKIARGVQYDPVRRCRWPGSAELACVDFSRGCSSVVTHASYAGERVPSFAFPDSCIPPKYVSHPGAEPVDDWPICPEAKR